MPHCKSRRRLSSTKQSNPPAALIIGRPSSEASILLATYDFANANKLFCISFVTPDDQDKETSAPFDGFLSFSSYLLQNAYRTIRATLYSCTCLLILRILVEDQAVMKSICSGDNMTTIRLCRQTQPLLPLVRGGRLRINAILDVLLDGINHNLKKRLDIEVYRYLLSYLVSHTSS